MQLAKITPSYMEFQSGFTQLLLREIFQRASMPFSNSTGYFLKNQLLMGGVGVFWSREPMTHGRCPWSWELFFGTNGKMQKFQTRLGQNHWAKCHFWLGCTKVPCRKGFPSFKSENHQQPAISCSHCNSRPVWEKALCQEWPSKATSVTTRAMKIFIACAP